jgi:hypothetical protein
MPLAVGKNGKQHRSHTWPGGHSKEMLTKAVRFDATLDPGSRTLVVTVHNVAAAATTCQPSCATARWISRLRFTRDYSAPTNISIASATPIRKKVCPTTSYRRKPELAFPVAPGSKTADVRLIYHYIHRMKGSEEYVIQETTMPLDAGAK